MKKGQSWSIDVIVGVVIFILVVTIFYAVIDAQSKGSVDDLKTDADTITEKLTNKLDVLDQGEVNIMALEELCDRPYDEVKELLGVEYDVCIFLEDENGNIIPCGTNDNKLGIGKIGDISLTDAHTCGEELN